MTGVLLAVPPVDFVLHNSLFLVAHFHNVIIGGVRVRRLRRLQLLVPQGVRLHASTSGWGKAAFWCWLIGFYLAFMPLYVLGLMGMTRRMQHYDVAGWQPLAAGRGGRRRGHPGRHRAARSCSSSVSIRDREQLRDVTGDPWNGRTLEWSTASPPPAFNFAVLPKSRARTPTGASSSARVEQAELDAEPDYQDDRDAAQQPDRLHHRLLRGHHGLRADLAHLVAGRSSAFVGAFATFVVVRLARPTRGSRSRPTRSRGIDRADRARARQLPR